MIKVQSLNSSNFQVESHPVNKCPFEAIGKVENSFPGFVWVETNFFFLMIAGFLLPNLPVFKGSGPGSLQLDRGVYFVLFTCHTYQTGGLKQPLHFHKNRIESESRKKVLIKLTKQLINQ